MLSDTNPKVQQRLDAHYRSMSPAEKVARMVALTELGYEMALARIRAEHPRETGREHRLRLCSRWLSREQMLRAFGWDPVQRGY